MSSDKVAKVTAVTDLAEAEMKKRKAIFDDCAQRVDMAKSLLRKLSEEEQKKVNITDSRFPELLDAMAKSKSDFEIAEKRYNTNKRYLEKIIAK